LRAHGRRRRYRARAFWASTTVSQKPELFKGRLFCVGTYSAPIPPPQRRGNPVSRASARTGPVHPKGDGRGRAGCPRAAHKTAM
jgi:hypothetical protein